MSVPVEVMFLYGLFEKFALIYFIFVLSDIKITTIKDKLKTFSIIIILTVLTLFIRNYFSQYLIIVLISVIVSNIFFVKISFKNSNIIKIIIGAIIGLTLLLGLEILTFTVIKGLIDKVSELTFWIISGIPHIVVIITISFIIRILKNVKENKVYSTL